MPEKPTHFNHLSAENSLATYDLEHDFQKKDFLTQDTVKKYAQKIANIINKVQSPEKQQIFLINLLSDDVVAKMVFQETGTETDSDDIKQMAIASTKAIKKQIIFELQPHLTEDLLLFVKENFNNEVDHFNKRKIVYDSNFKKSFLKETNTTSVELIENIREGLNILKNAIDKLRKEGGDMPYIVYPQIIESFNDNNPYTYNKTINYTVNQEDFINFEEVLYSFHNKFTNKQIVEALIDCLRGAKFIAENGLTLTDMQTRNIAINKKTKKGILFDLDGLIKYGKRTRMIVLPGSKSLMPPEYRPGPPNWSADSRSMIWDLGESIQTFAQINQHEQHEQKEMLIKLYKLSKKMMSYKPEDRPDFDTCIAELTKIVEEYFKEEKK